MLNTYCRLCEGACGLQAEIDSSGQLAGLQGDPSDPISGGFICETAHRSLSAMRHPDRIRQPMRRVDGVLTPVDWETAIQEIGAQLRAIRGQTGPGSLGMYLGDSLFWSSQDWVRSLAFGVGLGTAAVFSELCLGAGPAARITEMAIGYPTYLLPDVGRAHAILLLGGDQRAVGWGPLIAGAAHERAIQHSRKTKGTRVVVADPRRTPLADDMDQHLAVRPGTEPFLLLGMLSAIVQGGWHDHQFVDDYTHHFERLKEAVASWPVDRCAEICGVEKSILSGVALKFSRAAMGTILPGRSAFLNANASLGAWAWMALHGVTANLLRPGGLYEHRGLVDLQPLLSTIPTDAAPRTRVGGVPLLLMQAPATLLADEILTPGEGQVRALINIGGNPLRRLPAPGRVKDALASLELLVHIGRVQDDGAALADWLLPATHPWERDDKTLHNAMQLPLTGVLGTPSVSTAPPEARTPAEILRALFTAVRPGLRGSVWGRHLGLFAQYLARADLAGWEARILEWAGDVSPEQLGSPPYRVIQGASDRATWRPSTPDERLDLLPNGIQAILQRIEPPVADAARPLFLRTSSRVDRAPDDLHRSAPLDACAFVHPDTGVKDGQPVSLETVYGAVQLIARHDERLRPDTVDASAARVPAILGLLNPDRLDPLTATPEMDGLNCALR